MNALFVITLYTSFFSFVICFITMIISILTIVRRFDKQFKDAHVPGHLNIAFYGHAQRSGLYSAAIVINRNTRRYLKRYKKGAIYKYYGNFDFRAHCSSFEISIFGYKWGRLSTITYIIFLWNVLNNSLFSS